MKATFGAGQTTTRLVLAVTGGTTVVWRDTPRRVCLVLGSVLGRERITGGVGLTRWIVELGTTAHLLDR